jgi:hypothetical protein
LLSTHPRVVVPTRAREVGACSSLRGCFVRFFIPFCFFFFNRDVCRMMRRWLSSPAMSTTTSTTSSTAQTQTATAAAGAAVPSGPGTSDLASNGASVVAPSTDTAVRCRKGRWNRKEHSEGYRDKLLSNAQFSSWLRWDPESRVIYCDHCRQLAGEDNEHQQWAK